MELLLGRLGSFQRLAHRSRACTSLGGRAFSCSGVMLRRLTREMFSERWPRARKGGFTALMTPLSSWSRTSRLFDRFFPPVPGLREQRVGCP